MAVWLVGPAMYVFQTNQIEATINNQSNFRLQSYLLTSTKWRRKQCPFRVVSHRIMITGIETIYDAIYFFLRKRCFEDTFLLLKYKEKSLKAAKRHLEVELASVFFMAK